MVETRMPVSTFLRPTMSAKRGRNSENSAAAVKNTVCVSAICVSVVLSSCVIVASAGESMDAFSWNAKMATRSAVISATIERPPLSNMCGAGDETSVIITPIYLFGY